MSPVTTAPPPPEKICSAEDLRPLHLALLRRWNDLDDKEKREEAGRFRKTAASAGHWIKGLEERDTVQGLIDYWTATMATMSSGDAYPDAVLLAEFSEKTVKKTARKCPYVGLNAFDLTDAKHYFGREADVDAIIAAFKNNTAAVIVGPAGMGKTSLAQAGVAGRLLAEDGPWVLLGSLLPGRDPVGEMLRAVRPANADRNWFREQRATLTSTPEKFRELAEALLSNPEQRLLIIVDRAEELFASDVASNEIAVAAAAIASLAGEEKPGRHRVIFTIREDFLPQLRSLINSTGNSLDDSAILMLSTPGPESLRDAIVKPGEVEEFRFDEHVVESLVNETTNLPDALPLLEFTLTYLWNRAEVDRVSWADYTEQPRGSQLLSDVGERAYADLPSDEAREAARVVFTQVIRLGQNVTLRRVGREDLEKCLEEQSIDKRNLESVLDGFVDTGLLRRIHGENDLDDRFELSHSAIVRHWPRLLIWVQEKRRAEAGRERYNAALERWRANGRSYRYILPLSSLRESGKYRHKSSALDEYILASRRWWAKLGAALLFVVALVLAIVLLQGHDIRTKDATINTIENEATAQSRQESEAAAESSRQAMIADQSLLRALYEGRLARIDLPEIFLERVDLERPRLPSAFRPYDPQFLGPAQTAKVLLPEVSSCIMAVRCEELYYPRTTVIYDKTNKIPLVVASNVDLQGEPLAPFRGIGFFPEKRKLPRDLYEERIDRVSPDRNYGRVPILDWRLVGRAPAANNEVDSSFLAYQPFSVLQPWKFYDGVWSQIDRRLIPDDAKRLTILTGAILPRDNRRVRGAVIPSGYWKAAIHWDERNNKLVVDAYSVRIGPLPSNWNPQNASTWSPQKASTPLTEIAKETGINFGASPASVPSPTASTPKGPTVYLQFAGMPRDAAVELSRKLAEQGYHFPPEEPLRSASGLAEVRFVRTEDEEDAKKLAQRTEALLLELGYGEVTVIVRFLKWVKDPQKIPLGTLELWVGLPRIPRPVLNQTFEVADTSDNFLSLRLEPSTASDELVKMKEGKPVQCGDSSTDYPGWRPCTYTGGDRLPRHGFAAEKYLISPPANVAGEAAN